MLAHLERCTCLNTTQIHLLEFQGLSIEMAHRCCRRLEKKHRIKRGDRISFLEKDYFWIFDEKKPKNIEHTLGKSWVYTFIVLNSRASNYLNITFENEPVQFLPIVKPDQFMTFDTFNDKKIYFNEFTRYESGNEFKKIKQYNNLAEKLIKDRQQGISTYWWIDLSKNQTFVVLIVTDGGDTAKNKIQKIINRDKLFPYSVELLTIDEIKNFCLKLHLTKKEESKCSQEFKRLPQS